MWYSNGLVRLIFDLLDPIDPYVKPAYYTYKLIETLLPRAKFDPKKKQFKMLEL